VMHILWWRSSSVFDAASWISSFPGVTN
jgi:hypothetical protein